MRSADDLSSTGQGTIDTTGYPSIFFGVNPVNAYLATLSEYHTFSPSLVNEFRLGYNRFNQPIDEFGNQSYPGLDQFPNITVYETNAIYGPDPNAPQFTIQNLYQLADNVTWTKGKHSFKFGFDGWSAISPSKFTPSARAGIISGTFYLITCLTITLTSLHNADSDTPWSITRISSC